jgi:hypothetical protein
MLPTFLHRILYRRARRLRLLGTDFVALTACHARSLRPRAVCFVFAAI